MKRLAVMFQGLMGVVVGLVVAGMVTTAQGATIVNGSFESGTGTVGPGGDGFVQKNSYDDTFDDITGWTIIDGSVDWVNNLWPASDGNYSLDLSGNQAGTIQTTITGLDVGEEYQISFDMSGNGKSGDVVKDLIATVITDHTFSFDTSECCGGEPGATDFSNMQWITYSLLFVATDTTEILTFRSLECNDPNNTTCFYGPTLDNVQISAVPIPAALPLLLSALGFFGFLGWRRKKVMGA